MDPPESSSLSFSSGSVLQGEEVHLPDDLTTLQPLTTKQQQQQQNARNNKATTTTSNTPNKQPKLATTPKDSMKTPIAKGSGNHNSSSAAQQSSFTRRAHKFSSLKKKKGTPGGAGGGPTNLLNKLFCSPSSHTNQTLSPSNTMSVEGDENANPSAERSSKNGAQCVGFQEALATAVDSLQLNDADKVRESVQENMFQCQNPEAVLQANHSSTPLANRRTMHSGSLVDALDEEDSSQPSKDSIMDLTLAEEKNSKQVKPMTPAPAVEMSLLRKSKESKDAGVSAEDQVGRSKSGLSSTTPPAKESKILKTPGGLVIPTPFLNKPKQPITMDGFTARKINKSPVRSRELGQASSYSPTPSYSSSPMRSTSAHSPTPGRHMQSSSGSGEMVSPHVAAAVDKVRMKDVSPHVSTTVHSLLKAKSKGVDKVEALRQSIQKRQSVLSPKTSDIDDDAFLPDDFERKDGGQVSPIVRMRSPTRNVDMEVSRAVQSARIEMEAQSKRELQDAIRKAKDEWQAAEESRMEAVQQEWEEKLNSQLAMCKSNASQEIANAKSQVEEALAEHGQAWKSEHSDELSKIKETYEGKIAELKDQALLAQRLAKSRENQLAQTENDLSVARQVDTEASGAAKKEVDDLKVQLNELKSSHQQELETAKANLSRSHDELKMLRIEMEAMKKERSSSNGASTPGRKTGTPVRKGAGPTTPNRSPRRTPSSKISTPAAKKQQQLHEREMESLRRQITVLEEQTVKTGNAHEHALAELRESCNREVARIKKELEVKLEQSQAKTQELQASLSDANSQDRDELMTRLEELEQERRADRVSGLKEVQKKEDLTSKISALEEKEKKLVQEHEQSIQDLRLSLDGEIQKLRQELAREQEQWSVKEKELTTALSESSSFEKEELMQQIEKLQTELESEKSGSILVKLKLANVEKDMAVEVQKIEDQKEAAIAEQRTQLQEMQSQVDACEALKKAWQVTKAELEAKVTTLEESVKEKTEALEEIKQNHMEEVEKMCNQLTEQSALSDRQMSELEDRRQHILADVKNQAEKTIEAKVAVVQGELNDRIAELSKVKAELVSTKALLEQPSDEENKLRSQLARAQAQLDSEKKDFDARVRKVGENHSRELDELLKQLDLVEAEHQERLDNQVKAIADKDQTVKALGDQLADAEARMGLLGADQAKHVTQLNRALEESSESKAMVENLKRDLQWAKTEHEKFVKESERLREEACNEARDETIARAESQFKQANDLYIRLKKQFDNSTAKVARLEQELKSTKLSLSHANRQKEECEVDLRAEVAQLRAANAKIEAETAQKAKAYRKEMEGLLKAANDFESKAAEAESISKSVQTTLANVVAEKQRLQKTHDSNRRQLEDMKLVCEELMSELEGQQQGRL